MKDAHGMVIPFLLFREGVWQYTATCLLTLPSSWVFKTNEEKMIMAVQYQYSTTHKEARGLLYVPYFGLLLKDLSYLIRP